MQPSHDSIVWMMRMKQLSMKWIKICVVSYRINLKLKIQEMFAYIAWFHTKIVCSCTLFNVTFNENIFLCLRQTGTQTLLSWRHSMMYVCTEYQFFIYFKWEKNISPGEVFSCLCHNILLSLQEILWHINFNETGDVVISANIMTGDDGLLLTVLLYCCICHVSIDVVSSVIFNCLSIDIYIFKL